MSDFAGSSTPPSGGMPLPGPSSSSSSGTGRFSITKPGGRSKGDRKLLIDHEEAGEAGSASASYGSVPEQPMALRGITGGDDRPGRHPG